MGRERKAGANRQRRMRTRENPCNHRSRPASCTVLRTGASRYSSTLRLPCLISATICMPGVMASLFPCASSALAAPGEPWPCKSSPGPAAAPCPLRPAKARRFGGVGVDMNDLAVNIPRERSLIMAGMDFDTAESGSEPTSLHRLGRGGLTGEHCQCSYVYGD